MNCEQLAWRITRDGSIVTLDRYHGSGFYEVTKEIEGTFARRLFDTGREAWRYYRHNRGEVR